MKDKAPNQVSTCYLICIFIFHPEPKYGSRIDIHIWALGFREETTLHSKFGEQMYIPHNNSSLNLKGWFVKKKQMQMYNYWVGLI